MTHSVRLIHCITLAGMQLVAGAGHACLILGVPTEHGMFSGPVAGQFVTRPYADRPLFQLSAPFHYEDPEGARFDVAEGYVVDGASVPRAFWSFVGGPFSGHHLNASVVHDYYTDLCQVDPHDEPGRPCQNSLDVFLDDEVVHRNYYLGMLAEGVSDCVALSEYLAVSAYKSWDLDQNGRPINIEILGRPANRAEATYIADAWSVLRGAAGAVTATLRATDGRTLSYLPDTQIPATPEGFQDYVERLRNNLDAEVYRSEPDLLGLLLDVPLGDSIADAAWPEGFLDSRVNPQTNRYEDLTLIQVSAPYEQSVLAQTLNLRPTETIVIENTFGDQIGAVDPSEQYQQIILDYLERDGVVFPDWVGQNEILIQPSEGATEFQYQLTPRMHDLLQGSGQSVDLGTGGLIVPQQGIDGVQNLFLQPAPFN